MESVPVQLILQLALALSHQGLSQPTEARACIDDAHRLIRKAVGSGVLDGLLPADPPAWLRCRVLLREAKVLYYPTFPADPFFR
jgi:hypothetical protein